MAIIRRYSPQQNLSKFGVFLSDTSPNSEYFGITELGENLTGGKNGFLIQGSECLKESTDIRVEILDVQGNTVYFEPGKGEPEYYEGLSKLVSVIVYDDTPIGIGKITILGELKSYFDEQGNKVNVPEEWEGVYNVKWERSININRNLPNESRVRFTRRPKVQINELVKPIFDKTIPTKTQSGSLQGEPFLPPSGQKLSDYGGEILYKLIRNTGDGFEFAMDDNQISIPSLTYNPTVVEVLNDSEVLVNIPYTSSAGEVIDFAESSYTSSFEDVLNTTTSASTLTGSFAEIKLTNLKTFVGDVARLKVFRKSRSEAGDFKMVQEIKLESSELLRDFSTDADTELSYGVFDSYNLSNYWLTSSNSPVTRNNTELLNSIKIDYSGTGTQLVFTSQSIDIGNDIEYNLSFKSKLSGSVDNSKKIRAYLSGSDFTQSLGVVSGSSDTLQRFNYSNNTLSLNSGSAQLVFEVNGDDWYISNVSFRHAEETSFSPDEFTFLQDVPRKLTPESFDFKFEFYDINNNFIPVIVETTKAFDGGNLNDSDSSLQLAEVNSKINRLNAETASINLSITSIENTTASFDSSIESLNLTSESLNLQTASLLIGIDNAVESGSVSASNAVTSGSLFADNAVESGSVSSSNAVTSGSGFAADAVQSGSDFADNAVLSGSESANAAAASASVVSPGSGLIHRPTTPTGTGLFLSKERLGHYDSGEWKTYMSSSGDFYLTGSASNYLQWDGSSLTIRGDITIASGETADQLSALNSYTSSNDSSINNLNSATSSLQDGIDGINATTGGLENPSQYSFGPDALFDLASFSTPSTAGLYLGSTNMGYYNSGWKTYMDSSGNFYLTGSASNYLIWNGSSLQIRGDITIASGETADQLNALNSYTSSNDSSISNLNSTTSSLNDSVSNLNTTTSSLQTSASNAAQSASNAQDGVDGINATTSALENPTSYDFGPGGSNSTFDLSSAPATPSVTGLYLGSTNLGYYNTSEGAWRTYMDNTGQFFLGGDGGALQWNGTTLSIEGNVNITGGATANQLSNLNSTTASLSDSVSNLNSTTSSLQTSASNAAQSASNAQDGVDGINATTSSLENPTTFTPTSNANETTGLHLGSNRMGYYNGGWKTYMDSSGNFYLGGDTNGALSWNNSTDQLVITGSIFAENGIFSGTVSGSSIEGGQINIAGGTFSVDGSGSMVATNAVISGEITSNDATLGGWIVDSDAITSEDGNVVMHATDEYIQVSDTNGIPRATLSTDGTLPSPSSGGTNVTQTLSMSHQTRDVGPPGGLGQTDDDSGTLTQNLSSFTTGTSGAHSMQFTYTGVNRNFVQATGLGSYATMNIRIKLYSNATYTTLVGQTSSWNISVYGNDTQGGFSSVIGNTKILLSNGFIKKAKDITKNDTLLVWDYKTNQFVESDIKQINKRKVNNIYRVTLNNGLVIDVSDTHGFWLDNNEQVFVKNLVEGESKIYIKDSSDISLELVTQVELIETEEEVFTFRIPNYENYISNGIISHNPVGGYPNTEQVYMSQPQTRSGTMTLANSTTYYPRVECSYTLSALGHDSQNSLREANLRFDHDGNFAVNSISAGTTINGAGLQTNSNDTKVFRLETGAASSDAFGTLIGGLTLDGLEHGRYLPMDTSVDTDSSYGISSSNRAKLDLYTFSYGAGRAQCTVTFNESTSVATLQNSSSTNYACVNVDGISFTNINSDYSQNLRINFITGHASYSWTPLVMSYGRTHHSGGNDADGLDDAESVNNHAAKIGGSSSAARYCDITIRDNDGNDVRVPEVLQLVCLG